MPGHHIGPPQKILRTPSATRQRQDAEPSQKSDPEKDRERASRSNFEIRFHSLVVPWFFHLNATSAARRGAHVSPVTYRSQRTKRAPDIPCPVPTRHQRSWSRRLFHSAQSIRLLETESRFSVDPELDLPYPDSFPAFSHDGKKLAVNDIGNDPVVMASVSVMDADGTNALRIFRGEASSFALAPQWSPKDDWIAFGEGFYFLPRGRPARVRKMRHLKVRLGLTSGI
jgi:hypothetical protein